MQPTSPDQSLPIPPSGGAARATVRLEGNEAIAVSPEGVTARMPIEALLKRMAPEHMDSGRVVLPDGIKAVISEGPLTIWVHECPPRIHSLRWIAPDSPSPFGEGATYRTVRLALPYLIVFAVFGTEPDGRKRLIGSNEAFFRTEPLKSLGDMLSYPALLNCSKFVPPEGRPLSWICTQHLRRTAAMHDADPNISMRAGLAELMHCLLETGFNFSSEHHESSSWYTESARLDRRLYPVERWQEASAKDPLFALEVPWLPTAHSVRDVASRIFKNAHCTARRYDSADAVARAVFNRRPARPSRHPMDLFDLMKEMDAVLF